MSELDHKVRQKQGIGTAPRGLVAYLLLIEFAAVIDMALAVAGSNWTSSAAGKSSMIFVLAVAFEEVTRRLGRLRIKLSEHLKPDMTSVWSFAAALTLPSAYVVVLVSALLLYKWLRIQRPAGEALYRKIGTASTILLACLVAGEVVERLRPGLNDSSHGISDALVVVTALVIYTAVNRSLVTGALLFLGARGRDLLGTRDDNLIEFATLCLGGLASLAILHQPWLTFLVLVPMALLQRSAVVKQLEIAATTDARTGLWTALAWEELSQRELARSHREQKPVAVLMVDLDRFKAINDTYGHFVGDVVLKAVGQRLRSELRGYDLIGRLGGEEFVALLPGVDQDTAVTIAERLRVGIAEFSLLGYQPLDTAPENAVVTVSASIGVACTPTDGTELTDLLHAADSALYSAKHGGRNQVRRPQRHARKGAPADAPPGN